MKANRTNFSLCSVKVQKNGGLNLTYDLREIIGDETYQDKESKSSSKIPHPDLTNLLKSLVPTVARVFGHYRVKAVAEKENPKLKLEDAVSEILSDINVTGIHLSGSNENSGLIISATYKTEGNQKVAINTHRIRYTDTVYGFEEDLEEVVQNIEDECFKYLYEGKKAQLQLFDEETED